MVGTGKAVAAMIGVYIALSVMSSRWTHDEKLLSYVLGAENDYEGRRRLQVFFEREKQARLIKALGAALGAAAFLSMS